MNAPARWGVVRNRHGRAGIRFGELPVEPSSVSAKECGGLGGSEQRFGVFAYSYFSEIVHEAQRFLHRLRLLFALAKQHEIRPQRCAQKAPPVDGDLLVIEHLDVSPRAKPFEFLCGAGNAAAVELVVPENVEHRLGKALCPRDSLSRASNVSPEDYHIGVILRYVQGTQAQM